LGIDPAIVRQLKPFVQILPPPPSGNGNLAPPMTLINANTAPAEVLMAALPGITLPQAQQIVLARRVAPFKVEGDVLKAFGGLNYHAPPGPAPQFAVASSHFEIYGQLRYEQSLIRVRSVVYRPNQFSPIQVLRRERIPPDAT
jgi:general secretion pathway protein K